MSVDQAGTIVTNLPMIKAKLIDPSLDHKTPKNPRVSVDNPSNKVICLDNYQMVIVVPQSEHL